MHIFINYSFFLLQIAGIVISFYLCANVNPEDEDDDDDDDGQEAEV